MPESELKAALLTRRAKLAEQVKSLTRQIKACDTMLAGLDAEDSPPPTDADVNQLRGNTLGSLPEVGHLALRDVRPGATACDGSTARSACGTARAD